MRIILLRMKVSVMFVLSGLILSPYGICSIRLSPSKLVINTNLLEGSSLYSICFKIIHLRSISYLSIYLSMTPFNRTGNFVSNVKFMTRLLHKYPQSVPLMILVGHHSSMSNSFNLALREYFKVYQLMPNEPIVNLCIGKYWMNISPLSFLSDLDYDWHDNPYTS